MNQTDKKVIIDTIMSPKTKWGEYFQRFYENHTDLFWKFRELNQKSSTDTNSGSEFQMLGREVESQMFHLESLLTSRQMWWKSTDRTVTAFYDLVASYFPLYGKIE
jgi:hypothetical protein